MSGPHFECVRKRFCAEKLYELRTSSVSASIAPNNNNVFHAIFGRLLPSECTLFTFRIQKFCGWRPKSRLCACVGAMCPLSRVRLRLPDLHSVNGTHTGLGT